MTWLRSGAAVALVLSACDSSSQEPGPADLQDGGAHAAVDTRSRSGDLAGDECTDRCEVGGSTRCEGGRVVSCGDFDNDGCLEWGSAVDCPDQCLDGRCATGCQDECPAKGQAICDGSGPRTCGDFDADDCLEWGPVVPCTGGKTCSGGQCALVCDNECAASDKPYCDSDDNSVVSCGNFDGDDCLDQQHTPCAKGSTCQQGVCDQAPVAALACPAEVNASESFVLDASGSSDKEGGLSSYSFSFGDQTPSVIGAQASTTHSYAAAKTYLAMVEVVDSAGQEASASCKIVVHPAAPTSGVGKDSADAFCTSEASVGAIQPGASVAREWSVSLGLQSSYPASGTAWARLEPVDTRPDNDVANHAWTLADPSCSCAP